MKVGKINIVASYLTLKVSEKSYLVKKGLNA